MSDIKEKAKEINQKLDLITDEVKQLGVTRKKMVESILDEIDISIAKIKANISKLTPQ